MLFWGVICEGLVLMMEVEKKASKKEEIMVVESKKPRHEKKEEFEKRAVKSFKPKVPYLTALVRDRSKDEMRKFIENFQIIAC